MLEYGIITSIIVEYSMVSCVPKSQDSVMEEKGFLCNIEEIKRLCGSCFELEIEVGTHDIFHL